MKRFLMIAVAAMFAGSTMGAIKITNDDRTNILEVNSDGSIAMPVVAQVPFLVAVASGQVSGYSAVNKFGHNPTVATGDEDLWAGGGFYGFYPTNAQSMSIVSSSVGDDTSSTGAHTVIVYGLDANWLETSETATMDGTTSVALTNTYRRMYRGIVLTIGTSASNVGNITVTNSAGDVAIYIAADDGQTQQAIYTIPAGKTGYFLKGYVGVSDGGNAASRESAQFKWKARLNNGTTGAWQTKGQIECINDGGSWWQYEYGAPSGPLAAKTDIRLECTESSATLGVVGGYDILLIDD